jgi:KipI family sensor histidine kinase inhibitor
MLTALPAGADGLLIEVDDPARWYHELVAARARGDLTCEEIVPGARTVLLAGLADPAAARRLLECTTPAPADTNQPGDTVEIAVEWDGADLAEAATAWHRDPAEILRERAFTVAFCGFAPGFGYLTGLPEPLHLPRRATPRPRVPAGSVATAGPYVGIYPRDTPGGWHLLGRTSAVLFDPRREPPTLLSPGMIVRFVDA